MRDLPFQRGSPPPGWRIEAALLIKENGCSSEAAVEAVVLRFLNLGNLDPLLDAALRGYVHTPRVLKYAAAMLDANYKKGYRVRYCIDIEPRRQRGRPRQDERPVWGIQASSIINRGVIALAEGKDPGFEFWLYFNAAVDPAFRRRVEQQRFPGIRGKLLAGLKDLPPEELEVVKRDLKPVFPLKAKLRRGRGRPFDPQLKARDRIVAENVRWRRLRGDKYLDAVEAAAKGGVSIWQARRAYDGDVKLGRKNRHTRRPK